MEGEGTFVMADGEERSAAPVAVEMRRVSNDGVTNNDVVVGNGDAVANHPMTNPLLAVQFFLLLVTVQQHEVEKSCGGEGKSPIPWRYFYYRVKRKHKPVHTKHAKRQRIGRR